MALFFGKKKEKPFVSAVIPAAGSSTRMGGGNKLMLEIDDIPVLARTIMAFENCGEIDEIILVCREQDMVEYQDLIVNFDFEKVSRIVRGGKTRTESVLAGVRAAGQAAYVAIHDGARPLVSDEIITDAVRAAIRDRAAAPVVPIKDSVKKMEGGKIVADVPRSGIVAVQTPQCFERELILEALERAIQENLPLTDDCSAVELLGVPCTATEGSYQNLKITTPEDLEIAETLLHMEEEI